VTALLGDVLKSNHLLRNSLRVVAGCL
jgi:hypothetical protein